MNKLKATIYESFIKLKFSEQKEKSSHVNENVIKEAAVSRSTIKSAE